jgi:hypothetical protein
LLSASAIRLFTGALPKEIGERAASYAGAPGADPVFAWTVATALTEFVSATGRNGVGEEHRTSALMGFLASFMGTYNLLAGMSGNGSSNRMLWHASNKRSSKAAGLGESETGGDFGIAIPAGVDSFRISFFQAKNLYGGRLDLRRPPRSDTSSDWPKMIAAANLRLARWATDGVIDTSEHAAVVPNHQMFKLAAVQKRGNGAKGTASWVHYVVWSATAPVCFSLDSFRQALAPTLRQLRAAAEGARKSVSHVAAMVVEQLSGATLAEEPLKRQDFGRHLVEGAAGPSSGWLELPMTEIVKIVGNFVELGGDWYFLDERGGSRVAELTDAVNREAVARGDVAPLEKAVALSVIARGAGAQPAAGLNASATSTRSAAARTPK